MIISHGLDCKMANEPDESKKLLVSLHIFEILSFFCDTSLKLMLIFVISVTI